jgi:transcriptional regulator with XRE-family HTH domain
VEIKNENDINGVASLELRTKLKLTQKEFWGAVCVSGSRGCAYETGKTPIPAAVRRLLFLHYVLGIPTDINDREVKELAKVAAPARRARRQMDAASSLIDEAAVLLNRAKETMNAPLP